MIQSSWHTKTYSEIFVLLHSLYQMFSPLFPNMNFLQKKKCPVDRPVKYFASPKSRQVHKETNLYVQLYLSVSMPSYKGITHSKGSGHSGSKAHRILILPCSDAPLDCHLTLHLTVLRAGGFTDASRSTHICLQVFTAFTMGTNAHLDF